MIGQVPYNNTLLSDKFSAALQICRRARRWSEPIVLAFWRAIERHGAGYGFFYETSVWSVASMLFGVIFIVFFLRKGLVL